MKNVISEWGESSPRSLAVQLGIPHPIRDEALGTSVPQVNGHVSTVIFYCLGENC